MSYKTGDYGYAHQTQNINNSTYAAGDQSQLGAGVAEQQQQVLSRNTNVFNPNSTYTVRKATGPGAKNNSDKVGRYTDVGVGDSAGQNYWKGVAGKYDAGGPGYVQNVNANFDADVDPDLGGYYDAAFGQASRNIDKSAASRGQYGSSATMQQIGQVATNLGAERANREAQYGLDRQEAKLGSAMAASGDEREWTQGMGALAFGAGNEDLNFRGFGLEGLKAEQGMSESTWRLGLEGAMQADNSRLATAAGAMDAASIGQASRDSRIQAGIDNTFKAGDRVFGGYGQMLAQDAEYAGQQTGTGLAGATDSYNIGQNAANSNYAQYLQALQTGAGAAGNSYGFGGR